MKAENIGNITLVMNHEPGHPQARLLLGLKPPLTEADKKRKRKRVGADKWGPPGGAREPSDTSHIDAAQRELEEETGLYFAQSRFKRVGILQGKIDGHVQPIWLAYVYLVVARPGEMQIRLNKRAYVNLAWFGINELCLIPMLARDREWIPELMAGHKRRIFIVFHDRVGDVATLQMEPL